MPTSSVPPQAGAAPPPNPVYLSFLADVNPKTTQGFMGVVGHELSHGRNEFHLLLSTPGGNVRDGLAIYHLLQAIPAKVVTYNVGSVNSIGNMIYLAGVERYAAPASSFMFHGVGLDVPAGVRLEEKNLREAMANLTNDQSLIADVIARHTTISRTEVAKLFLEAAFISAADARSKGIVHDVRDIKVPPGAPFIQLVFQG